jgi:hypothetical protein
MPIGAVIRLLPARVTPQQSYFGQPGGLFGLLTELINDDFVQHLESAHFPFVNAKAAD